MSEQNDKLNFFIKGRRHKLNMMLIIFVSSLLTLTFCLESLAYFGVAEAFGHAIYSDIAHQDEIGDLVPNLFFKVDEKIPWFTPLIFLYIPWPFIWFILLPAVIYFGCGRHAFFKYSILSISFYLASILIYAAYPTTCSPYIYWGPIVPGLTEVGRPGAFDICSPTGNLIDDPLYPIFKWLMGTPEHENINNIFGSLPSFHNFWAAVLVLFGIRHGTKIKFRVPMIVTGLLLSLSTIMIHQHNILDVIVTYVIAMLFWLADEWFRWSMRLDYWVNHKLNEHPATIIDHTKHEPSKPLCKLIFSKHVFISKIGKFLFKITSWIKEKRIDIVTVAGTLFSTLAYGMGLIFMFTSLQETSWYTAWHTTIIYLLLSGWFFFEVKIIMHSKKVQPPTTTQLKTH